MINIQKIIQELAKKRPIFHSEADFQHALAWEIQKTYQDNTKIRLEKLYEFDGKKCYIDLVIETGDMIFGIELKYKTKMPKSIQYLKCDKEEHFYLKNQGAQDLGRYDFIKDICRLEEFCNHPEVISINKNIVCYAILLTNDLSYKKERKENSIDFDFGIHQNRNLYGILKWSERASAGTTKNREKPLILSSSYHLSWEKYSEIDNQTFEYLLVEIGNFRNR